jgi:hypothetical protein
MSQRIIAKFWLVLAITTSFIAVARQSVTSVPGASSIQSEQAAKPLDPEQALANLRKRIAGHEIQETIYGSERSTPGWV